MAPATVAELDGMLKRRESQLSVAQRRAGAHFTSLELARRIISRVFALRPPRPGDVVLDPTAGAGSFLLAAAIELENLGFDRTTIATRMLRGFELDPTSASVANSAIRRWAGIEIRPVVEVRDVLSEPEWGGRFAYIVGNPPFQSQLARTTARARSVNACISQRLGQPVEPYADTAGLIAALGGRHLVPDGAMAWILPHSIVAARDASTTRALLNQFGMSALWFPQTRLFEAAVNVVVGWWHRGHGSERTQVLCGPEAENIGSATPGSTWSALWAIAQRIPHVRATGPPLSSVARATAGFRDEYYAVANALVERETSHAVAPVLTCGLVDEFGQSWETRDVRILKRTRRQPMVDLQMLPSKASKWVKHMLMPKTVIATQTRVLEAWPDEQGIFVPLTPLISLFSERLQPRETAALLTSPFACAWLLGTFGGAGWSDRSLKVSARQLVQIPIPASLDELGALAELCAAGEWERFGIRSGECYGLDPAQNENLVSWWVGRRSGLH